MKFKFSLKKLSPLLIIVLSFFLLIIISSVILYLPFSLKEGIKVSYIDSLFTATTSICVTGLVSVKEGIAGTYSTFGQIFIGILIQIGGLGVTTFAVMFFLLLNKRVQANQQNLIKESFNLQSVRGIKKVFYKIVLITFSIELIGALILFLDFYFINNFPLDKAMYTALFHSVSSYNNAGIDIIGTTSLFGYNNDPLLLITTASLIIIGGIGYFVLIDLFKSKFNYKKIMLHTKVVLIYSFILIIFGTSMLLLTELHSKSGMNFLNAFFMSVSSRTAGYASLDLSTLRNGSLIILLILMFIGASPGGSGGGIKTSTFALCLVYLRSTLTGKSPSLFKRNIKDTLIKKAFLITILGLLLFLLGYFMISVFEGDGAFLSDGERVKDPVEGVKIFTSIDFAFEAMSAFGTVGLSTGFTPYFTIGSKIILIILMYLGRVGPLTFATSFKPKGEILYRYVSEDVTIG